MPAQTGQIKGDPQSVMPDYDINIIIDAIVDIIEKKRSAEEISVKYGIAKSDIYQWKKKLQSCLPELFLENYTGDFEYDSVHPELLKEKNKSLELQSSDLEKLTHVIRRQNKKLERFRKIAENANNLKSEFLSNMSHEIRTPLNSILTLSRVLLLKCKDKLNREEIEYIEIIERNGKKLFSLLSDILELSKIEAGVIDLKPRELSIISLIEVITENLEQSAEVKGIKMNFTYPSSPPQVESDESCLIQIFQNIIGNALKFTQKGSVNIEASFDSDTAVIKVIDTGIGIAPEDLPYIFDEFRQLDGTLARKFDGTGLGLAIAHKSAMLIYGVISVESKPDEGSIFTVRLPLKWKGDPRVKKNGKAGDEKTFKLIKMPSDADIHKKTKGPDEKPKILIIEDDPDNLVIIKVLLENEYILLTAQDGMNGLEIALSRKPDAILLDMALPKMNGFMVVKRLKEKSFTQNIPVIAMTALTLDEDKKRIIEAGCDDYISKPYNIDALRTKIKRWITKGNEQDTGN